MEHCPTCNLQYKRNNKYYHELTNTHFAADSHYYCQQSKRIINLADRRFHLQSNEHDKKTKDLVDMEWHENINTKPSHIKSAAHIKSEVISRINENLQEKTYTNINPDFEQVDE